MSNILLVLLWLTPDRIGREVREKVAAVGVAYSADAVNYIIKSLYERYTYVDVVVVYGPDFRNTGSLIIEALRGICNEALRIPCEYVKNLGVTVVDMRWKDERELREALEKLYRKREAPARRQTYLEIQPPNRRKPYRGPHVIYDTDLEALRIKAIDYILTYGEETRDVIYGVLMLQKAEGSYATATCDLLKDWPCGLDRAAVLLAAPAYIQKAEVGQAAALIKTEVFQKDVYDPHGNFYLGDVLYHYSPDGVLLRAVEITEGAVRREAAKLLPDHAFYLGQEYAAYRLLKERYVQDGWKRR
ncbi:MAG: thymidylate synthase [Pyrobaculum sp.]